MVTLWIWRSSGTFVIKPKAGRWRWQKIGCNICQIWNNGKYVSPPALTGRYIMTRTDFGSSRFPDDEDGDGPRNSGLLAVQPLDGAASPRIFYWKWIATFCKYLFMSVVVWVHLAHNRDQWQVFVNTIMNLRLSWNAEFVDSVKNVFHGAVLPTVETEAQDISGLAVSSQNLMFVNDLP